MIADNFQNQRYGDFYLWQYKPWSQAGVLHGFTGSDLDFHKNSRKGSLEKLKRQFALESVHFLEQVHGDTIVWVKNASQLHSEVIAEGDAIIVSYEESLKNRVFGVLTADCLPVIIRHRDCLALVHAGWRGLANCILIKTLSALEDLKGLEIVLGPCAGVNDYIVGREVVDAIPYVSYREENGEIYLDIMQTALKQIKEVSKDFKVLSLEISTISNDNFHSYRRSASKSGRNFSFIGF